MDSTFWSLIFKFRVRNKIGLDTDFSDKMNYVMTSAVFLVATLMLSIRYFCGKVITCWCPNEFLPAQIEFVENYCWTLSTYYYNMSSYMIPESHYERESRKLNYYQWIPFLLIVCSMMYNLPIIIYRVMNWRSGVKVAQIMSIAADVDMTQDKDDREGSTKFIARYLREALCVTRRQKRGCCGKCKQRLSYSCLWCGRNYGNYLVLLYLGCKCLFLANAIGQFFIMYKFLGAKHTLFYGFEFLQSLATGGEWDEIGAFPREAYCDITLKRLYNNHRYTVQCLLPINLFAEKIFIFLWFWYCIITVATTYSLITWSWLMVARAKRIKFVKRYLEYSKAWTKRSNVPKSAISYFVDHELRYDGVFLLRFISLNCGELVCLEIVSHMWRMHRRAVTTQQHRQNEANNLDNDNDLDFFEPSSSRRDQNSLLATSQIRNGISNV